MKTGAIILAAGAPGEIQEAKPMLCVGQKPMIKQIVELLEGLSVRPIVVVAGYRYDIIGRCLADTGAVIVRNRRFAETDMFTSLKLGITALKNGCDRAFVFPADLPLVKPETLQAMMSCPGDVVKPRHGDTEGHPLLISSSIFPAIEKYEGAGGLRALLSSLELNTCSVSVEDEGIALEANSYEEYEKLIRLNAKRGGHGKLHPCCQIQLAVEDVVMDSDTMQLMEMLQCTGSLQLASELLRVPYTRSWRKIKNLETQLGVPIVRSAKGGVKGGGSQLTEQGTALLEAYQKMCQEFSKMANWVFHENFSEDFVERLQKMN